MMRQVSELLWIGSEADVRQFAALAEAGIEAVVQLAYEEPPAPLPRDLLLWRVPLYDGADNPPERLRLAVTAVEQMLLARIPTLVACSGGMSRSPAIAAVALARVQGGDATEILERLRSLGALDVSPALWADLWQQAR